MRATQPCECFPLTIKDTAVRPRYLDYREWQVTRATARRRDAELSARAAERVKNASTANGPLFDMREESGRAVHGAGFTFLTPPLAKGTAYASSALGTCPTCRPARAHLELRRGLHVTKVGGSRRGGAGDDLLHGGPVKSYPANGLRHLRDCTGSPIRR
jgi:hypothetical protein